MGHYLDMVAQLVPPPNKPQDRTPEDQGETHADRETRRFLAVCRPWPDARGWYDPGERSAAEALARADDAPIAPQERERQPDRDKCGMTAVERAERWRAEWKVNGYPTGVKPKADDKRG